MEGYVRTRHEKLLKVYVDEINCSLEWLGLFYLILY